jgi:hypothetical protein
MIDQCIAMPFRDCLSAMYANVLFNLDGKNILTIHVAQMNSAACISSQ